MDEGPAITDELLCALIAALRQNAILTDAVVADMEAGLADDAVLALSEILEVAALPKVERARPVLRVVEDEP